MEIEDQAKQVGIPYPYTALIPVLVCYTVSDIISGPLMSTVYKWMLFSNCN